MTLQTTVNFTQALGVAGALASNAPIAAKTATVYTASHPEYNVFGRAFTSATEGYAAAGGTAPFFGIMISPNENVLYGTTGNPLGSTLAIPNYQTADFLTMGEIYVTLPAAATIGDLVQYATATGILSTVAPSFVGTVTQSTTTLTVATATAGNLNVGSQVHIAGASMSTILALGTGTGGTGTYTVDTSQTVSSAAAATAVTLPADGYALVPNAKVTRYSPTGSGLAVIALGLNN